MDAENKALEGITFFHLFVYVVCVVCVVMLLIVFAFCLRTNEDSSMREFDKS